MAIVWILEKPRCPELSLISLLIGDFSVRAFASEKNFLRLTSHSESHSPDLVIIRSDDFKDVLDNLIPIITARWDYSKIILIGEETGFESRYSSVTSFRLLVREHLPFKLQKILAIVDCVDRSVQMGDVSFDFEGLRLKVQGHWFSLTPKEALLIKVFLRNINSYLSYQEICNLVWKGVKISPRSIASHVSRIRKYFSTTDYQIHNIYGGGYQMKHDRSE